MLKHAPALIAAVALVGTACGDSLSPEDIAGDYDATVFEFTSVADPTQKIDAVQAGFVVTISISPRGLFTYTANGESELGRIEIDGSDVTITLSGGPATGTISRSGDTVTMNLTTGIEFDFDDDGNDEEATLRIVMVRAT